ncbi:MAG TPA: T9SS type A sorting domain-containing protein [Bacteroidota bacterium]|nr:T9SS type A sorting domain-containing protein [Bacteroidota bacterium]
MKVFGIVILLCSVCFLLNAQQPSLYFSAKDTAALREVWKHRSAAFPQLYFKTMLAADRWNAIVPAPTRSDEWPDYDRLKASKAKAFAFRYLMEEDEADGDAAFDYLYVKYAADNYTYEENNYARWMTNGLALIDYCAAFDLLAGAGYFNAVRHTNLNTHDQAWWSAKQTDVASLLHTKAAALLGRVKTPRSGAEAFSAQMTGNQTILNEVKFHAQVGNHRIIVASALGVAAFALSAYDPHAETKAWLEFARRDVEQFLLNRQRYPIQPEYLLGVTTQNAGGAFPEGMEYLNYSAEGFVPFFLASAANGGEQYDQDTCFKNMMDWVYDLQAPDGASPQINSTGYAVFPLNSLFADRIPLSTHYLQQLETFASVYGESGFLPVEGFCLLSAASKIGSKTYDPVTVARGGGEVIMRNHRSSPTRYLLITTKHGPGRSAAELHGYADAGSFLFSTDKTVLVRQPGYAGYSASKELETAASHSTLSAVVNGKAVYDAPDRAQALPPTADASVLQTKSSGDFSYVRIVMDINGVKPVSSGDIFSLNSSILNLAFEYISSNWMSSRINMTKYGTCTRQFLMVNNSYLIVVDDVARTDQSMQYVVSSIQGNNGNNTTQAVAVNGAERSADGDIVWHAPGNGEQLRVHTAALGGIVGSLSGFDTAAHQSPDQSNSGNARVVYYHAAMRTAAPIIDGKGTIISVLEVDPSTASRSSVTHQTSDKADSACILYTVDGRNKSYGSYDLILLQSEPKERLLPSDVLPYPVSTDASFLVMTFSGGSFTAGSVKLFARHASFVRFGPYVFTPSDSGETQMSFTMKTEVATSVPVRSVTDDILLSQNYPNPFNPIGKIRYSLGRTTVVTLAVFDMLGREVARLVDGVREAGVHESSFDASALPAGVYLYKLSAGGRTIVKKMSVVK